MKVPLPIESRWRWPLPFSGCSVASAAIALSQVGADEADDAERGQRIFGDMAARRADRDFERLAVDRQPERRALIRAVEFDEPEFGLRMLAEGMDMLRRRATAPSARGN